MAPSPACPFLALAVSLLAVEAQLPPAQPRELSTKTAADHHCQDLPTAAACNADLTHECYWDGKCLAKCPETAEEEFTSACACGFRACDENQWCNYTSKPAPTCQAKCRTFDCADPHGLNHGWSRDHTRFSKVCSGPKCDFEKKVDRERCCRAIPCWREVNASYDQTGRSMVKLWADEDLCPVDKYRIGDSPFAPKTQPVMMSAGQGPRGPLYVIAAYPPPGGKKRHGDFVWSVKTGDCIGTLKVYNNHSWFGDSEKKKQIQQQKRNARRLSSVKRR